MTISQVLLQFLLLGLVQTVVFATLALVMMRPAPGELLKPKLLLRVFLAGAAITVAVWTTVMLDLAGYGWVVPVVVVPLLGYLVLRKRPWRLLTQG